MIMSSLVSESKTIHNDRDKSMNKSQVEQEDLQTPPYSHVDYQTRPTAGITNELISLE